MRITTTFFGPAELKICILRPAATDSVCRPTALSFTAARQTVALVANRPNCNLLLHIQLWFTSCGYSLRAHVHALTFSSANYSL